VDNFTGGTGNDTFTASTVYDVTEVVTAASTLDVGDAIAGGEGTDTLNALKTTNAVGVDDLFVS